jgi:CxxC motif-containing protein (DUF1111 family)
MTSPISEGFQPPAPDPTDPGFEDKTNGFEPQEAPPTAPDTANFKKDKEAFETPEDFADGLGPVYNSTSCVACHQNPVTGSSSQISELRAGYQHNGKFVEPAGGSLIHQRAVNATIQELAPWTAGDIPTGQGKLVPVHTRRMATTILGDGFVEMIPDQEIVNLRHDQPIGLRGTPTIARVNVAPILDASGKAVSFPTVERIGRFGWKCQEASLLNFSIGAYINEMGITSPASSNPPPPLENKSNNRDVGHPPFDGKPEPEDDKKLQQHPFGDDVEAFTRFMRSTKAPPQRKTPPDAGAAADIAAGKEIFMRASLGCAVCHHPSFTTPAVGTDIKVLESTENASDLPNSKVPPGLGGVIIFPYSDFMLHDIGTGDGIAQGQHAQLPSRSDRHTPIKEDVRAKYQIARIKVEISPQNRRVLSNDADVLPKTEADAPSTPIDQSTRNKIRTAPLWGLRVRPELLHDGSAYSVEEAIIRHKAKSADHTVRLPENFASLTPTEKRQLLSFLYSL